MGHGKSSHLRHLCQNYPKIGAIKKWHRQALPLAITSPNISSELRMPLMDPVGRQVLFLIHYRYQLEYSVVGLRSCLGVRKAPAAANTAACF